MLLANTATRREAVPSAVIEVNGLVKKYGGRVAVASTTFSILKGGFGLLGPNSASKTPILEDDVQV